MVLPIIVEFSEIKTDGIIHKIGLLLLSLGGVLALAGHGESFICVGIAFIYVGRITYFVLGKFRFNQNYRRTTDK